MTIYAVGDLHGNLPEFQRALRLITADGGPDAEIVWLGDYVDRGADSRGVIDELVRGRDAGRPWHFLLGNHDRMFRDFMRDGRINDAAIGSGSSWLNRNLGGQTTIASYGLLPDVPPVLDRASNGLESLTRFVLNGVPLEAPELAERARAAVPQSHHDFLQSLVLCHETEDLFFTHAGVRPGLPLDMQIEEDLIWIRHPFLKSKVDHGKLVVHGHTPVDEPLHAGNRVAIDTGAGYGRPVTAAAFEGRDAFVLGEAGRKPLLPA